MINFSGGTNTNTQPTGEVKEINGVKYQKVNGGWQKVSGFNSVGNTSGSTRADKNNNPLNIKVSGTTLQYPGVSGIDTKPATDGGNFLVFDSPEAGIQAASRLIRTPGYMSLSVDSALRRWSGNGYGDDVAPQFRGRTIASLSDAEIQTLLKAMAKREGYSGNFS